MTKDNTKSSIYDYPVLNGCLFAIRGFVSTGIEHDTFSWFNF